MLARAHQLFSKTNQFNLTTRRYTLAQLEAFSLDANARLLMIHAEDRFGDMGWISAVLLQDMQQPVARIDNFVLSCRAMGRAIESAILNHVKAACFARPTCLAITAEYAPTAKNAPVRELYEEHGFSVTATSADGHKTYRFNRDNDARTTCDWIEVELISQ